MTNPPEPPPVDWPSVWRLKDGISTALLVELGVTPQDVLMRNAPKRGELEVDGDALVLVVVERNKRGGLILELQPDGSMDARHEVRRVQVSPERLALYRADLAATEVW